MAKSLNELRLEKQGKSILNSAEEENKVGQIESILSGIGSGLIQIPKGIFSLGATLIDLGADTNKAAAVEKWFDDLTTLDEKAAATTAGKITELLVNIGVPGGIGFKVGTKLAQTALTSKKAGKYFGLVDKANNKILVDSTTKLAKLNAKGKTARFAAGAITGGAMEGVFIGDVEAAGTFGNLLGGPTQLHKTIEGDNDPARALVNRVKFGTEGALFTGVIGGVGKTLKLLARRNEATRFADNKMDKVMFNFVKKFQKEGGTSKEFFKRQREIIGAKYADINTAQQYGRELNKNIDGLFPFLQRYFDSGTKANRKDLLKILNDGLISGTPRVGKDGTVTFGEKITRELFDPLTKSTSKQTGYGGIKKAYLDKVKSFLKKNKIKHTDEQVSEIFKRMEDMRGAWGSMFSAVGQGIKAGEKLKIKELEGASKEFKKLFGNKFKDYLGATYDIFQNKSLIPLFTKSVSTEVAEKAAREFMRIAAANKNPISWQQALMAVDNIAETARAPKNFDQDVLVDVPHFFTSKSMAQKAAKEKGVNIKELSPLKRKVVEEILGKTEDPIQTILAATGEISAITRRNQLLQGLAQNSKIILRDLGKKENGLRPLLYDDVDQIIKKAREMGDTYDPGMYTEIIGYGASSGIKNPTVGKYALKEVAEAIEMAAGKPYEGVATNALYRNLILFPKATSQMAKTILSAVTHARNFVSAGAFSVANGILPGINITPTTVNQAWRSLQVSTGLGTRDVNYQELYRKLTRLGVVNTNVRARDVAAMLEDVNFGTLVAGDKALRGMLKPLSKIKSWTQDMYTAEDDFWKINTFLAERARLATAYERAGVKLGKNADEVSKALDEEAADIVRNNVPNYDYVSQFVKDLRKFPLGNFVAFPAEILRTSSNILQRALHEIKTPALRRIGWQRLAGMTFTTAAVPAGAVSMGQWLYDISDDELQAIKRYVADWSKNSTIIPLRGEDITDLEKEGSDFKYIDFSHANAYDTLTRPWQAAMNQVATGAVDDKEIMTNFLIGSLKGFGEIMQPFISESIWTEALIDLSPIMGRGGKTAEGYTIYDDNDSWGNITNKIMMHMLKSQMPGSLKQLGRIDYAVTPIDTALQSGDLGGPFKWGKIGKYDENGQSYELLDEGLGILGMRAVDVNVARGLNFKQAAYASGSRKSKSLFTKIALKAGPRDPEELVDAYINANRGLFDVQQTMGADIDAAKTLKIKPVDMYQSLARLSRKDLGNLQAGIFQPYTPSRDVIEGMHRNARKMGLPNPYNRIAFAINNILRKLYRLRTKKGSTFPQFINPFSVKKIQEQETIQKINNAQGDVTTNLQSNIMPPPGSAQGNTNLASLPNQVGADGLTSTERALLPPDEQQYYREKRGIG